MQRLWPAGWRPGQQNLLSSSGQPAPQSGNSLILTLALPPALQAQADAVRQRMAPVAARHAPAHISLFRHLSGLSASHLFHDIQTLIRHLPRPLFKLQAPKQKNGLWMTPVLSPDVDALRAELAERWFGLLAPGDKAPPRLHVSLGKTAGPVSGGSSDRQAPPILPAGPWHSPALLCWHFRAENWSPLVAFPFHG